MLKCLHVLCWILYFIPDLSLYAQQEILLQRRIGTDFYDNTLTIKSTAEGGCIAGVTDPDYVGCDLFKFNGEGIQEWTHPLFPEANYRNIFDIEFDGSGSYWLACIRNPDDDESINGKLLKISPSGDILLAPEIGGPGLQYFKAVKSLPDGGTVVAGYRTPEIWIDTDFEAYVTRFNSTGGIIWDTEFNDTLRQLYNDVVVDEAFAYCLGSTNIGSTDTTQGYDVLLAKVSLEDGSFEWIKTFGGNFNDEGTKLARIGDKLYIVGSTESNNLDISANHGWYDVWIIQTDLDGNLLWEKTYGGTLNEYGQGIGVLGDHLVIGAVTSSEDGDIPHDGLGWDYWVFSIDQQGNIQTNAMYGGNGTDYLQDLDVGEDGSVWVIGYTNSTDILPDETVGFSDGWFLKLGGIYTANEEVSQEEPENIQVYPNPAGDWITIKLPLIDNQNLTLYNALGDRVLQTALQSLINSVNIRDLSGGIYFYEIHSEKNVVQQGKIVKQ
jgi:hypothetical protein